MQINNIAMTVGTLEGEQQTTISFNLSGVSDSCPELIAEVWLETPVDHEFTLAKPEDMKVSYQGDEVVNDDFSHMFTTSELSGEYYAHVTVTPVGFECAMALVEECTEEKVIYPCGADLSDFSAVPAINFPTAETKPSEMEGISNGIEHSLKWSVSDLYNCNLYAVYDVVDTNGGSTDSQEMTWDELYAYHLTTDARVLVSETSYYDFKYSVELFQGDSDAENPTSYARLEVTAENPHKSCEVDGSMTSSLELVNGVINVHHEYNLEHSYTCSIETLVGELNDGEFTTEDVATVEGKTDLTTKPTDLPALVYDSFPITVDSKLTVSDGEASWDIDSSASIWPKCQLDAESISFTQVDSLVGTDRKLTISPSFQATVGQYCPQVNGSIQISLNGELINTVSITPEDVADATEGKDLEDIIISYGPGKYCASLDLVPSQPNEAGEKPKASATQFCLDVETPACEITATNDLSFKVDHTDFEVDWVSQLGYTASEWCSEGELSFTYQTKYKNADEWVDAVKTADDVTVSWSDAETDMHLWTNYKVEFKNSKYGQADQEANAAKDEKFEETCRPAIDSDDLVFNKITLNDSEQYKINLPFTFQLAGSGMKNCNDLGATYTYQYQDGTVYQAAQPLTADQI